MLRGPRLLAVLAVQAIVLGMLATGALGTSSTSSASGSPQLSTPVLEAHDTSVPLKSAPDVPNNPDRTILELGRTPSSTMTSTTPDRSLQPLIGGASIPGTSAGFRSGSTHRPWSFERNLPP